jgi:hypothetical protein
VPIHHCIIRSLTASAAKDEAASTQQHLFQKLVPFRQKLLLPSGKQLIAAALLTPAAVGTAYYSLAYCFRRSICYDHLQKVDGSLHTASSSSASRSQTGASPLLPGTPAQLSALRKELAAPAHAVTVIACHSEQSAVRFVSSALAGRPATVHIALPARATADSFTAAIAEGLGLHFLKVRCAVAAALPTAAFASTSRNSSCDDEHVIRLRTALATVTAALAEIRADSADNHLPPVVLVEGLLSQLQQQQQQQGDSDGASQAVTTEFLQWCHEVSWCTMLNYPSQISAYVSMGITCRGV